MDQSMLSIKSLTKKYEKFTLSNITLDIPKGCIVGLVGQNGAGKSTLLKSIFGMIPFESGEITFDGKALSDYGTDYKELVCFISEEQHMYSDMTVEWHIKFASKFFKNWDAEYAQQLLERFELNKKKKIKELSKGMHTKLALLIGLSHKAKLLLLDEPTSGLDPVVRSELLDIMQELLMKEDTTILFSSHISSDIEQISDYVAFLHNGQLICVEDKHTLIDEWKHFKYSKSINTPVLNETTLGRIEGEYACSSISREPKLFASVFNEFHKNEKLVADSPTIDAILLHIIKGGLYV